MSEMTRHTEDLFTQMNVATFVDTRRTLLPCTGVGRHVNGVLLSLAARGDTTVTLLAGADQLTDSGRRLPANAPLRALPAITAFHSARRTEQLAKATGLSLFDRALPAGTEWIYSPHDTLIASKKVPVAVTFHDARLFEPEFTRQGGLKGARHAFMRSWMRRAADAARVVFTMSEFSKERLVTLMGLDPDKVIPVGNGLEAHVLARSAAPASVRADRIVTIGGLRRLKGGDLVVAVAEHLAAAGAATEILSIGGPDDPDLVARAARLPNVRRAGFLNDDALADALASASALLFPSRYEGFGMPPIEAMALGTPVIAAACGSLPEILGDGAVLIDPDDIDAAIAALDRLRYDNVWRDTLVARGRDIAHNHSWEHVAERVLCALQTAA